jgi:hypothetical protein
MILVKSFPTAKEAQTYIENLKGDPKTWANGVKKEAFEVLIISAQNLPFFYKKSSPASYKVFYLEAYKTVITAPKQ